MDPLTDKILCLPQPENETEVREFYTTANKLMVKRMINRAIKEERERLETKLIQITGVTLFTVYMVYAIFFGHQ